MHSVDQFVDRFVVAIGDRPEAKMGFRESLRRTPLAALVRWHRQRRELARWQRGEARPTPPPLFKQQLVRRYARDFDLSVFVETGTYHGDMIAAVRRQFEELYSIEMNPVLAAHAAARFADKANVCVIRGDSGERLGSLLTALPDNVLFWLDAHAMVENWDRRAAVTPLMDELSLILARDFARSVILIDDARLLDGTGGYPHLAAVRRLITCARTDCVFEVQHDIVRISPIK